MLNFARMSEQLRVTLVQNSLIWENPGANRRKFDQVIKEIEDTDLVILPEMCTTGFSMNPEKLAEQADGPTLEWLKRLAQWKNIAVIAGVMVQENDAYYNRLYFVEPNGSTQKYDKRHLFSLAGEEKIFSGGREKLIIDYKGFRINPQICYDLRFPVWSRNTEYVDLICYIANWPERRAEAWKTLLKARAIENMCYVAGVNRVGDDGNGVYHSGDSAMYDVLGRKVSTLPAHDETTETITVEREVISKARSKYSFLEDRDTFEFKV